MSRHGTWTETGAGGGSGPGVGVLLAVVAGAGLAVTGKHANTGTAPAAEASAEPVRHAVAEHAAPAVQAVQQGPGVGFWALVIAAVFAGLAVLTVAGLAVAEWTARRRALSGQVDSPAPAEVSRPASNQTVDIDLIAKPDSPSAVQDAELSSDRSVVHLSDWSGRRRSAGGDAA